MPAIPPDVRFNLISPFTDPRGLNAQYHIVHGMLLTESLGMSLCNWIVHADAGAIQAKKSANAPPGAAWSLRRMCDPCVGRAANEHGPPLAASSSCYLNPKPSAIGNAAISPNASAE